MGRVVFPELGQPPTPPLTLECREKGGARAGCRPGLGDEVMSGTGGLGSSVNLSG